MADFLAYLGNGSGSWFVWTQQQVDATVYNAQYLPVLLASASSAQAGRKEMTAHSQKIFENSAARKEQFEQLVRDNVTKVKGIYTFNKRFFFNQALSREQVLDYITAGNHNDLMNLVTTEEMTDLTGGIPLIDAAIGGTV
jgi:hypothetical protein